MHQRTWKDLHKIIRVHGGKQGVHIQSSRRLLFRLKGLLHLPLSENLQQQVTLLLGTALLLLLCTCWSLSRSLGLGLLLLLDLHLSQ